MKTRVTQSDIARAAGVHNTTVSLALRNSPSIPASTRNRIRAIAEKMGYAPDPVLQALVAYRNGRRRKRRQQTIAYITNWETKWGWRTVPSEAQIYLGAERKASQFGYQLEHFALADSGMTDRRLSDMLFHRGITAVLLASHRAHADDLLGMDWSKFSAVKIGAFPQHPRLHRVTPDYNGAVRQAVKRAAAAGYRRIGLVIPRWYDNYIDQAWSAAFVAEQHREGLEPKIPLFIHHTAEPAAEYVGQEFKPDAAPSSFQKWYFLHRPDAIISCASGARAQLESLGLSAPRDVAYVDLALDSATSAISGIFPNCERVGEVATELLVGHMDSNEYGLPEVPTTTLIDGSWVAGQTLRNAATFPREWHDGAHKKSASDKFDPAVSLVAQAG